MSPNGGSVSNAKRLLMDAAALVDAWQEPEVPWRTSLQHEDRHCETVSCHSRRMEVAVSRDLVICASASRVSGVLLPTSSLQMSMEKRNKCQPDTA